MPEVNSRWSIVIERSLLLGPGLKRCKLESSNNFLVGSWSIRCADICMTQLKITWKASTIQLEPL